MIRRSFFGKLTNSPRSKRGRDEREETEESGPDANPPHTVREMVELEQREKIKMSVSDRIADSISALAGSMLYVWLHVAWFGAWILMNTIVPVTTFDPYPFGLLTMIVSLEAIFLSTFVLISQNRQARLSDKRAKLDLQVNLISEQEVTTLLRLVGDVHKHLGLGERPDKELEKMQQPTHLRELVDHMDAVEEKLDRQAADGPGSAVDTEA